MAHLNLTLLSPAEEEVGSLNSTIIQGIRSCFVLVPIANSV